MRIAVIGAGYAGLVAAAGLADFGLTVTAADIDVHKIELLQGGKVPLFEPGLEELVRRNLERGRLRFTAAPAAAVRDSSVIFIAVPTGGRPDATLDLSQLWAAADAISGALNDSKVVVIKSTVPVGTARQLEARLNQTLRPPLHCEVVSNPEFLREGSAVEEFFHPNRVVIGTPSSQAAKIMEEIYRPLYLIATPFVFTTWETAELIKLASNGFLALKISFINELANLCDAIGQGADVHVVARALGLDPRIGSKFLHPGPGFGGSCLPKDARALAQIARQQGTELKTVEAALAANAAQHRRVLEKLKAGLGSLEGKTIAILGLSFKAKTDDVRESQPLKICEALLAEGCSLRVFDPAALPTTRPVLTSDRVRYCSDSLEAVEGCDALVVATEWNEFRNLDLAQVKRIMRGAVLVDARNVFDAGRAKNVGFHYYGMGRS
ncbi:MAG: UDP-glucose dehydrogenase family protein [Candidatus Acidiferrales bacterium]